MTDDQLPSNVLEEFAWILSNLKECQMVGALPTEAQQDVDGHLKILESMTLEDVNLLTSQDLTSYVKFTLHVKSQLGKTTDGSP